MLEFLTLKEIENQFLDEKAKKVIGCFLRKAFYFNQKEKVDFVFLF